MDEDLNREVLVELKHLHQAYQARLPDKLAALERLWQSARERSDREALAELQRGVQHLVSSAGVYGYSRLSDEARQLHELLQALLREPLPQPERLAEAVVSRLEKLVLTAGEDGHQASEAILSRGCQPLSIETRHAQRGDVLLLDDETASVEPAFQLSQFGYRVDRISDPTQLYDCVGQRPYGVVIVDLRFAASDREGIELITVLRHQQVRLPAVIFLSSQQDIGTRLLTVRAGGRAFFTKPLNVPLLAEKIDELLFVEKEEPYRILIVDDDHIASEHTASVLQQAGMLTEVVHDPMAVQQHLELFSPELIVMDLYLPGCSGLELAEVIRQQEAYIGTPIVFYSTESSINAHLEAMRRGGDDFMIKSVKVQYLVANIHARVSRARKIMLLMMRDSLTGLYNHSSLKEYLMREHAQARRYGAALAYALIDLDHFKQVNDRHGHGTGDRVLKSLAQLLRQRVRRSDIVGRYGGEEFAIIFPGVDESGACKILNEIREAFQRIDFSAGRERFSVSLSAGVADLQHYPELADLFEYTDKALYAAKEQGRNRVVKASGLLGGSKRRSAGD